MRKLHNTVRQYGNRRASERGFTLIELLFCLAILLVVSGAAMSAMIYFTNSNASTSTMRTMHMQVRATMEQLTQDISQAGLGNSGLTVTGTMPSPTIASNTTYAGTYYYISAWGSGNTSVGVTQSSNANVTVPYAPNLAFYPSQSVVLGMGTNAESLAFVQSSTSSSIIFTNAVTSVTGNQPPIGSSIIPWGLFNEGILLPDTLTQANKTSSQRGPDTSLRMIGDFYGNGKLSLVVYNCPLPGTTGSLTRSVYDILQNPTSTTPVQGPVNILDNVDNTTADANGVYSGCLFTYNTMTGATTTSGSYVIPTTAGVTPNPQTDTRLDTAGATVMPNGGGGRGLRFVLGVGFSVNLTSSVIDKQTQTPLKMSRSIVNVQPRNIMAGYLRMINYVSATNEEQKADRYLLQGNPSNATVLSSAVLQ